MGLKRTAEPGDTPVSLAELKAHARIDGDHEDDLLVGLILAATSMIENYIGRSLMEQTWRFTLQRFSERIELPRGPVRSISSFAATDGDGTVQDVGSSVYSEDLDADPPALVRNSGESWPSISNDVNPIVIEYVAGYDPLPADIKQALLMLVASWYSNRETLLTGGAAAEMPLGTMALLQNHRAFFV